MQQLRLLLRLRPQHLLLLLLLLLLYQGTV
jgi:hypothetical protein